jgi:hypothetical protein
MTSASTEGLRVVTVLLMLRNMPVDDFAELCCSLLTTSDLPSNDDTSQHTLARPDTCQHVLTHPSTPEDAPAHPSTLCDICGGPVEPSRLSDAVAARYRQPVCKPCIDIALSLIFGPDGEAIDSAEAVIELADKLRAGRAA